MPESTVPARCGRGSTLFLFQPEMFEAENIKDRWLDRNNDGPTAMELLGSFGDDVYSVLV